jgi:hypothetical protein
MKFCQTIQDNLAACLLSKRDRYKYQYKKNETTIFFLINKENLITNPFPAFV